MKVAVVWFRNALRIHDNPVLSWAYESENADFILPIYIFEEEIHQKSTPNMGEQRLRFQFDCLENLHQNLKIKFDLDLHVFSGDCLEVLESIREQLQPFEVTLLKEYSTNGYSRILDNYQCKVFKGTKLELFDSWHKKIEKKIKKQKKKNKI